MRVTKELREVLETLHQSMETGGDVWLWEGQEPEWVLHAIGEAFLIFLLCSFHKANEKSETRPDKPKKQKTKHTHKKKKRKTKKRRERTDGRWVCVRFWSSRLLLTHSHTGIRHTACSEGKNDEPLHSVSHCLSTVTKERSREERGDVVVEEIQNFEVELVYYIGWLLALLSS